MHARHGVGPTLDAPAGFWSVYKPKNQSSKYSNLFCVAER